MKFEEKIMGALANFVLRYHKLIVITGIVLFFLSILSASKIEVKTKMKDLLSEDNPQVQMYEEIDEIFAGGTSVIITIEGIEKEEMAQCAEAFVAEVKKNEDLMKKIRTINLKLDRDFVIDWGFMLQKADDLEKTKKQFSKLNLLPFITALNDSFEETYTGDEAEEEIETNRQENDTVSMLNQMETFFTLLREYLENPDSVPLKTQGKILAETFMYGDLYGCNYDGTMLMFTISPDFNITDFDAIVAMMDEIKEIQKEIQKQFPNLIVGYTGDIAVQADEQEAMSFDMVVPAIAALIIILVLFIFSFNQIRSILFLFITLIIGIVFNYGFVGITIKKINMLTSVMSVLLIGLGIDYGIQVVTNFTAFRADGCVPGRALKNTYKKAGMGIMLAALTTAVAFFVMAATGSRAFAQFGVIMGTGIIMCFLSMILILPSILLWWGKKDISRSRIPNINYNFLASLGKLTNRHKRITITAGIIVTAGFLVSAIFLNRMEYDFMKLEPQDMPSIVQYEKVMEKYEITPFASMVIAESIEEARQLTEALEKKHVVAEINSISYSIPPDSEQDARLAGILKIREMPQRYTSRIYNENDLEQFADEVQRLEWNIIEMGDLSVAGLGEDNRIVKKRSSMIREIFGAEVGKPGKEVFQKLIKLIENNPSLYAERLAGLDEYFAMEMDRLVAAMAGADRRMTVDDLPESIANGLLDESRKRNLVMIYPKTGVLDNAKNMQRFNEALEEISPKITGSTQVGIAWMDEVTSSSKKSAIYIFIAIVVFLLLTFRNIRYTIFAVVPLICGMIWMLGIYPLLGMKINFLNIAVIPLVIGMGIDFGVHISHRFKIEQNLSTVYRYTGKGVFLSALTTVIGFGSLAVIGSFGSIVSIGAILSLGIATCLAATLIIIPALLSSGNTESSADQIH